MSAAWAVGSPGSPPVRADTTSIFIDLSLADGDGGQPQQRIDVVAVATQGTRVLGLRFVEAICLQSLIGAFERRGTAGLAELQAGILGGRGWPGSGFRCAVLRRGG